MKFKKSTNQLTATKKAPIFIEALLYKG